MSKTTIAIIAAASAAAGAGISAAIFAPSKPKAQPPIPVQKTSTAAGTPVTPPVPVPARSPVVPVVANPVDPAGLFQYGFPGPVSDLRASLPLVSSFNRMTRNPNWVAEQITPASLALNNADRKHSYFVEDDSLPAMFRAKLADYVRSGYDRGHQVPAADAKWSQEAMNETFLLTNMCPQIGDGFNRDYWAHFEDFCRRLAHTYPSVRIVTGPLYLPKRDPVDGKWRVSYEVIGNPPNVSVPTHFYKVIYGEKNPGIPGSPVALGAFVLPNAEISNERSLGDFEVPVEAVERASGLEFVSKLPQSQRKRLCAEVKCEILVREFDKERKKFGSGGTDQKRLPATAPSRTW